MSARCPGKVLDNPRISTAGVEDIRLLAPGRKGDRATSRSFLTPTAETRRTVAPVTPLRQGSAAPQKPENELAGSASRWDRVPGLELVSDYRNPFGYDPGHCYLAALADPADVGRVRRCCRAPEPGRRQPREPGPTPGQGVAPMRSRKPTIR